MYDKSSHLTLIERDRVAVLDWLQSDQLNVIVRHELGGVVVFFALLVIIDSTVAAVVGEVLVGVDAAQLQESHLNFVHLVFKLVAINEEFEAFSLFSIRIHYFELLAFKIEQFQFL